MTSSTHIKTLRSTSQQPKGDYMEKTGKFGKDRTSFGYLPQIPIVDNTVQVMHAFVEAPVMIETTKPYLRAHPFFQPKTTKYKTPDRARPEPLFTPSRAKDRKEGRNQSVAQHQT
jgi:hypothetical protein